MVNMIVPAWLETLLSITTFFKDCEVHPNDSRSECNMFCLDCNGQPFCFSCKASAHKDHRVIQIRRSFNNNVVRAKEIDKHVDIIGVQTYVINCNGVVFLNKRGPTQAMRDNIGGREQNSSCETCERNLTVRDPFCFCSLACKLAWIKTNRDESSVISAEKDEEMREISERTMRRCKTSSKRSRKREHQSTHSSDPRPTSRRKGIPHRAPFY